MAVMAPQRSSTDLRCVRRRVSVGALALLASISSCRLGELLSPPGTDDDSTPAAWELGFAVQPASAMVGEPIDPPPEIVVLDTAGIPDPTFSGTVTLALETVGTDAQLIGTTTRGAVNGVVAFNDLAIDAEGAGYRLVATTQGARAATSAPFDIIAPDDEDPVPSEIAIVSGDGQDGTVGSALPEPYVVRVTDAEGTPLPGVTVIWAVTSGGGSVSPGSGTTTAGGEASTVHTLGSGTGSQTVRATVDGLAPLTFTVVAAAASADELIFTVQPSNAEVDEGITPAVEITARDAYGNVASTFAGTISLEVSAGSGGGSLRGTTSRSAAAGVAVFPGLSIDAVGTGYRLSATASDLTGATSSSFDIIAPDGEEPVPTAIVIVSGDDQAGTVGEEVDDPYVVRVQDAGGDPVAGVEVSWSVISGGGSVSSSSSSTDASGQASATHTLGSGTGSQSVRATVSGLTPVNFTTTAVAGAAEALGFTVQPSESDVGETITPAVEISARDAYGNHASSFTGTVTLTLASGGGSLDGTTARSATGGIVSFPGLSVSEPGTGYRLAASAAGVAGATSAAFDIIDPDGGDDEDGEPATISVFGGNGQSGTVGEALNDPYVVRVLDAQGDPVAGVTVSWSVISGGGSVSPSSSTTGAAGRASATRTLGTAAGTQTTRATVADLSPVTFTATAAAGAPNALVFTTQPSDAGMGETISPPVRVTVRDQYGNVVSNAAGSITLSIVPLTGTPLATLSGTRTRSVSGGIATFDNLSINLTGVGYRLLAAGLGLTSESATFNILLF
jgi:hypothetical protein